MRLSFVNRQESPQQVFLIVIRWLFQTIKDLPEAKWSEVVVAYNNMCHLDGLKVAQQPLPFSKPYDEMWLKITKEL